MSEQMNTPLPEGRFSEVYERIEREGAGSFGELTDILLDLNKRLRRIED